jgi:hypothetical protein
MSKDISKISRKDAARFKEKPYYAYLYAMNVLKGRLPEKLEPVLGLDPQSAYLYSKNIIKGALPAHIHSRLILEAHDDEGKKWLQRYLKEMNGS